MTTSLLMYQPRIFFFLNDYNLQQILNSQAIN